MSICQIIIPRKLNAYCVVLQDWYTRCSQRIRSHLLIFEFRYFQSHCHRCINSSTKQSPFTNIFKSVNPPKELECGDATGCCCYKKSVFWNAFLPKCSTIICKRHVKLQSREKVQSSKAPLALTSAQKLRWELHGLSFNGWAVPLEVRCRRPSTLVHIMY